jgi:hypothetical protein
LLACGQTICEKEITVPSNSNRLMNRNLRGQAARFSNPVKAMEKALEQGSLRARDCGTVRPPFSDLQIPGHSAYHPTLMGKPTHWSA